MLQDIKNFMKTYKENYLYIVLGMMFLLMFFMVREPFGDDLYYQDRGVHDLNSLGAFLTMRYESWSSRMISETVIVLMLGMGMTAWRIFSAANCMAVVLSMKYLIGIGNSWWQNATLCMLAAAFPISYYASAGWVTTTSVYLFSAVVGLVALFPIRKWLDGKKMAWWEVIIYIFSAVAACNLEQVSAVLLGIYLCACACEMFFRHKIQWMQVIMVFICVISMIFIFTCPGNAFRKIVETEQWLPQFANWTLIKKCLCGVLHAVDYFFINKSINLIALILYFVMAALTMRQVKSAWKRALCAAGGVWLCASIGIILLQKAHIIGEEAVFRWGGSGQNMLLSGGDIFRAVSALLLWLLLAVDLYWLLGKSKDFFTALIILCAGFGSVAIVCFSPTIYVSGSRIFIFCYYAVYLLISFLLKKLCPANAEKGELLILSVTGLCSFASFLKNLIFLI